MNMIREQISGIIQDVVDGNESACKAHALLKELEQVVESGLAVIRPYVLTEAIEFNKDEKYYGGTWEIRNTPTYLDFSQDEVYTTFNKLALSRKKELNNAFKLNQEGRIMIENETGEQVPILPITTPSKEIAVFKPK